MSAGKDAKPLVWLKGAIKTPPFSSGARVEAGVLLRRLQNGERLRMPVSRSMPSIATSAHELRLRDSAHSWRIMYSLETDAVVILDVFAKATRKTPDSVIDACIRRLKTYRRIVGQRA
jgi:phage-related protein